MRRPDATDGDPRRSGPDARTRTDPSASRRPTARRSSRGASRVGVPRASHDDGRGAAASDRMPAVHPGRGVRAGRGRTRCGSRRRLRRPRRPSLSSRSRTAPPERVAQAPVDGDAAAAAPPAQRAPDGADRADRGVRGRADGGRVARCSSPSRRERSRAFDHPAIQRVSLTGCALVRALCCASAQDEEAGAASQGKACEQAAPTAYPPHTRVSSSCRAGGSA